MDEYDVNKDKEQNTVKTTDTTFTICDDGIFRVHHGPGSNMTLDKANEILETSRKMLNGRKMPVLVNTSELRSMSREARELLSSQQVGDVALAVALIIGSPVSRVIGNFFISLTKPWVETRLFTQEPKAIEWLMHFVNPASNKSANRV